MAYLDWAALRPLTELEFEKTVRGPLPYVVNGFAWGTNRIVTTDYSLTSSGSPSEQIANPKVGVGNGLYYNSSGTIKGPVRCGIFAASAVNKNREETGGSYYGVMELTGNIEERLVPVGSPTGRAFNGLHGDGILSNIGNYDVMNWTNFRYMRGGSLYTGQSDLYILNRSSIGTSDGTSNDRGPYRAGRTAD